jgi:hypothetical protein
VWCAKFRLSPNMMQKQRLTPSVGPSALVHSCTVDRTGFIDRLRLRARYPHRLLVITSTLSQIKSPYTHANMDPILNYCRTKVPFGVVEAINGNIKTLLRRGRGYKNLGYLLLKAQRMAVTKTEFIVLQRAA